MPDNYGQQFASGYAQTGVVPQGTAWVTTATPDRILLLDEATQAVDTSVKFALQIMDDVRQIADSILGAAPILGNGEKQVRPMPNGRIGGLKSSTDSLASALAALNTEVQRLRNL